MYPSGVSRGGDRVISVPEGLIEGEHATRRINKTLIVSMLSCRPHRLWPSFSCTLASSRNVSPRVIRLNWSDVRGTQRSRHHVVLRDKQIQKMMKLCYQESTFKNVSSIRYHRFLTAVFRRGTLTQDAGHAASKAARASLHVTSSSRESAMHVWKASRAS